MRTNSKSYIAFLLMVIMVVTALVGCGAASEEPVVAQGVAYQVELQGVAPPAAIYQIFPDEGLAQRIAETLGDGKTVSSVVTQAELDEITELSGSWLPINNLEGMQYLANLIQLTLNHSQISDLAPLAGLNNLTNLNLWNNQVSDLAPLAELTSLESLSLGVNPISDLAPLAGLNNLTNLNLWANQISNLTPLTGLYNLESLDLSSNPISDLTPLMGLHNLESLSLVYNQISDFTPLTGLANLESLFLQNNQISDLTPLTGLNSLTRLSLWNNQISDLAPLAGLSNLEWLFLANNQISDLSPLAGLINLTWLSLSVNQISDLTSLTGLTKLTDLDLDINQISDITPLSELTNLEMLALGNNQIYDFSPLADLRSVRVWARDQRITLSPEMRANPLFVPNVVRNVDGTLIAPRHISDSGTHQDGTITWNNLTSQEVVTYSWYYWFDFSGSGHDNDVIGHGPYISGTVTIPLVAPSVQQVTFRANGGTPATQMVDVTLGERYGALFEQIERPTKTLRDHGQDVEMRFIGWFTTPSGSGVQIHATDLVTEDSPRILYARWRGGSIPAHTLAFVGNGGIPEGQGIDYSRVFNATMAEAFAMIDEPVRAGYRFIGWAIEQGSIMIPVLPTDPTTVGTHFVAKWEPITTTQTLTFHLNGAPGENPTRTATFPGTYQIAFTAVGTPQRDGYTFGGWFATQAEANGTGSAGQVLATTPVTGESSRTLWARWTAIVVPPPATVNVTFVLGQNLPNAVLPRLEGQQIGQTNVPTPPVVTGYTFTGWLRQQTGNRYATAADVGAVMVSQPTTFVAQWEAVTPPPTRDITFALNGGNINNATANVVRTIPAGGSIALANIPVIPVRAGHTFLGWLETSPSGNATRFQRNEAFVTYLNGTTGNRIFTAQWEQDRVPVSGDHRAFLIGFPDNTMRPGAALTRAEAATIFFRLIDDEFRALPNVWSTRNSFADVQSDSWFNNAVSTMTRIEVIRGVTATTYAPHRSVTNGEFFAMLVRFNRLLDSETISVTSTGGHWASIYAQALEEANLIDGFSGNPTRLDAPITRVFVAELVNRSVTGRVVENRDHLISDSSLRRTWTDLPPTSPHYLNMVMAGHTVEYDVINTSTAGEWNGVRWTRIVRHIDWTVLEGPNANPQAIISAIQAQQSGQNRLNGSI